MVEEVIQLRAAHAGRGREGDAREEGCPRRTDVGLGRAQLQFRLADIGAACQQVRRQAGRNLLQLHVIFVGVDRQQLGWWLLAQQQDQRIVGRVTLALQLGQSGAGRVDQRVGLLDVQIGGGTVAVLQMGELLRLLAGLERGPGQRQLLVQRLQAQVGVGHAGHQVDLRGALGLFGGHVAGQGGVGQVLDPAEEVQLVLGDTQPQAQRAGLFAGQHAGLALQLEAAVDAGQAVGPLDAVGRLGAFDVQRGQTQVTVVVQRSLDELLQGRADEELFPADVGCRGSTGDGRVAGAGLLAVGRLARGAGGPRMGELAGHRGLRVLRGRGQGAAAGQNQQRGQQTQPCGRAPDAGITRGTPRVTGRARCAPQGGAHRSGRGGQDHRTISIDCHGRCAPVAFWVARRFRPGGTATSRSHRTWARTSGPARWR